MVKTSRWSQIIHINSELLQQVRSKYRRLDRAIEKLSKHMIIEGIPFCDFTINHAALKREREIKRIQMRTEQMQQSYKRIMQQMREENMPIP